MTAKADIAVALVGARGHTGAELIRIVAQHPRLDLIYAGSRAAAGRAVMAEVPDYTGALNFTAPDPETVAQLNADVVILAMPNGEARAYVSALEAAAFDGLLLDLSADYRFDEDWLYCVPELDRGKLTAATQARAKRIANPGCYATAAQLILAPLAGQFAQAPRVFGVSGYSGAGTRPSRKNDPAALKDNLIPYALVGHGHEAEMSRRAGCPVHFMPHVAPFFRGVSVTVDLVLREPSSSAELQALFEATYGGDEFVRVFNPPAEISAVVGTPYCDIGGFQVTADGTRAIIVATLDNLLKGAASQAVQNINLALGLREGMGVS